MTSLEQQTTLDTSIALLNHFGFWVVTKPAVSGLAARNACYDVLTSRGVLYTRCASVDELARFVSGRLAARYGSRQAA